MPGQQRPALQEAAGFTQQVLDALAPSVVVLDEAGIIVAVNTAWRRFGDENGLTWPHHGVGQPYLAGIDPAQVSPDDGSASAPEGIRAVMAGELERFQLEYPCHTPTRQQWYLMWATRFGLAEAGRNGVVIAHQEITERKLAELARERYAQEAEAARQREARRREVAEGLSSVLTALNAALPLGEVLALVTQQAAHLLSAEAALIVGLPTGAAGPVVLAAHGLAPERAWAALPLEVVARPDLARLAQPKVLGAGVLAEGEARARLQTVLAAPLPVHEAEGGALLVGYRRAQAVADEALGLAGELAAQAALALDNAWLRQRAAQQAVSHERGRLMRELHDSVNQALFSAGLIADALPGLWAQHPAEAEQGVAQLRTLCRTALSEMRTLLLALRPDEAPATAPDASLGALLRRRVEAANAQPPPEVTLQLEGEADLPPEVAHGLYRVASEALHNASKHAAAQRVLLRGTLGAEGVTLTVSDDGVGFAPDVAPRGLGLRIMRERAEALGARLTVQSAAGQGTVVTVRWARRGPADG